MLFRVYLGGISSLARCIFSLHYPVGKKDTSAVLNMHQIIHIFLPGCCQVAAPRRRRISRTSCLRHRNARSTLLSIRFLDIAPFWSRWISQPAPYHINQIQNATQTNPLTSGLFWKELLQTTARCRRIRKLVSWYVNTNQNKIRLLDISEDFSFSVIYFQRYMHLVS